MALMSSRHLLNNKLTHVPFIQQHFKFGIHQFSISSGLFQLLLGALLAPFPRYFNDSLLKKKKNLLENNLEIKYTCESSIALIIS